MAELTTEQRPLLNVREVAELLGCSISFIWKVTRRGQFPQPQRIGVKFTRWRRLDVEAWLAGQDNNTTQTQGEGRA